MDLGLTVDLSAPRAGAVSARTETVLTTRWFRILGSALTRRTALASLRGRATARVFVVVVGFLLFVPHDAAAIPEDANRGPREDCRELKHSLELVGVPTVVGLPLAFRTVQIDAAHAKIVAKRSGCPTLLVPLPRFSWSVRGGIAGLTATKLAGTDTLRPTAKLGVAGTYVIRLTACRKTCRVRVPGLLPHTFGPASTAVTVRALRQILLPPETEPTVRTFTAAETTGIAPFAFSERKAKCESGGGVDDPAWVTTLPFSGASDYQVGEGRIKRSRISPTDNFLNHDSQDHNWEVRLDPPYNFLSTHATHGIDMEWESAHMPRSVRPTLGDRTSTVGYWIFDCGHPPFNTEIHPPVAIATSRPRPVGIPQSFRPPGFPNGLGANVQVPGVVTEIWMSQKAGEATRNCSWTGLHQPKLDPLVGGACLREPNPVNRDFVFNVYLPRDPQTRLAEAGVAAPPVPLFVEISGSRGEPNPSVTVKRQGPATWLEIRVTPQQLQDGTYRRRVQAAWALPAANNWGLRRWRLSLKSLFVHDDLDGALQGDGDWRFYLNVNNRDQEWSKLIDCDGCIERSFTGHPRSFPSKTRTGRNGVLGPDLLVFPNQFLQVATNGFDDDTFGGQSTGEVIDWIAQAEANRDCRRQGCRHHSQSSGGQYTLDYKLRPGGPVAPALLTPEGVQLRDAYIVRAETTDCTQTPDGCFVLPSTRSTEQVNLVSATAVLGRRHRACSAFSLPVFAPPPRETYQLTGISIARMRSEVRRLRAQDPPAYRLLLARLRKALAHVPRRDAFPLANTIRQAFPPSDAARALPQRFRRRNAIPRARLWSPERAAAMARALLGPCAESEADE